MPKTKKIHQPPSAAKKAKKHKVAKPTKARTPPVTLQTVLPEKQLANFARLLTCISKLWQRDWKLHGLISGQAFTQELANEVAGKLFLDWYGPLDKLTDEQRQRIWELLPGVLVKPNGEVHVVFDADFGTGRKAIQNNHLTGQNTLKIMAYLAYVAHSLPPLVTLLLSDPCDTKLRLAQSGRTTEGNLTLSGDEKAIAKASLLLQDRRNALYMICKLLLDPILKPKRTQAGKDAAAAAVQLGPLLHTNSNETSADVYDTILEHILHQPDSDEIQWDDAEKERLRIRWTALELDGTTSISGANLKILSLDCFCLEVSEDSSFTCPTLSQTDNAIGRLADALFRLPEGKGRYFEENGMKWRGSSVHVAHDNKNAIAIRFLVIYRGHYVRQANNTMKVEGGNCGITLFRLVDFFTAFDKAKEDNSKFLFLYEKAFKLLVEGFHPCSFTVHTAEEGVLRLHAERVCGPWPFETDEPVAFHCFEKVRQGLSQNTHVQYWDGRPKSEGGWGPWGTKVRKRRKVEEGKA
ncbi:hypothetical protein TrCOL_g5653 [Triparma columacea]|uniref:Uncharacterized protein n=1 Tax=Triparma columacea TaxID=722753 RepID=A0A9W7GK54_9STRA|nr:hypothetical protein TrCOL_g5653 [Triparma columacea]